MNGGILTLDTIDRLSSTLLISRQAKHLHRIQEWVRRLDIPTQGADSRLYVYPVKNSSVSELAGTLAELFGTGESAKADIACVDNNVTGPGTKPVKLSNLGKQEVRPVSEPAITRPNKPVENNDMRIIAPEHSTLPISTTPDTVL